MPPRTRTARRASQRTRLRSPNALAAGIALAAVLGLALVGAAVWGLTHQPEPMSAGAAASDSAPLSPPTSAIASSQTASVASTTVEVPSVAGLTLEDAELMLGAAGFGVQVVAKGVATGTADASTVTEQDPGAGELVDQGVTVTLTVPKAAKPKLIANTAAKKPRESGLVVCIDPGHQAHGDSGPEPIGPGSSTMKPSVTGGATGVETRIPEYELALQIAMNLKARLESRGVKVVMTRTTNDVNLSNSERAAIANKASADLFVRVHCDGSPERDTVGFSTLFPAPNIWTKPISAPSRRAAALIQSSAVRATGAVDRGVIGRTDLSGFNYAKVASVLVECGFVSNPVEDRLLSSPHYQDKVAEGIADGAMAYLEGDR